MAIGIIDYGMGNLHSVLKSVQYVNDIGADIFLTSDPEQVVAAGTHTGVALAPVLRRA